MVLLVTAVMLLIMVAVVAAVAAVAVVLVAAVAVAVVMPHSSRSNWLELELYLLTYLTGCYQLTGLIRKKRV
jgi:hypothetical protein